MANAKETSSATAAAPTPGPWEKTNGRDPGGRLSVYDTGGTSGTVGRIALVEGRPEDEANATLIAAAPDLLEACRMAIDELTEVAELYGGSDSRFDEQSGTAWQTFEKLCSAFHKAGGRAGDRSTSQFPPTT